MYNIRSPDRYQATVKWFATVNRSHTMSAKKSIMKDVSHTPPSGEPVKVWERGRETNDEA